MLEQAAEDPFITETWLDILVENWGDILQHQHTLRKLPEILGVLSKTVVTREYYQKLKDLESRTPAESKEVSALLDHSIKAADQNIKLVTRKKEEIAATFYSTKVL